MDELTQKEKIQEEQDSKSKPEPHIKKENSSYGKTDRFKVPSGYTVKIREQDGHDEEILSSMGSVEAGTSIAEFLTGIILESSNSKHPEKRVTYEDVMKLKSSDRNYILLRSRLLSLGNDMKFKHTCKNERCGKELEYEQDLSSLVVDFDKELNSENFPEFSPLPYPNGEDLEREFTLSTGKTIRYTYLNSEGEQIIVDKDKDKLSRIDEFRSRQLKLVQNKKPQLVTNFRNFKSSEMKEIRKDMKLNDPQFEIRDRLTCPSCKKKETIGLAFYDEFFFPTE